MSGAPDGDGSGSERLLPTLLDVPRAFLHVLDTRQQLGRLLGKLEVSKPRKAGLFLLCLSLASAAYFWGSQIPSLGEPAARGLFILALATGLWVTEATPAFAVGILVIGLDVMLLARPGSVISPDDMAWQQTIAVLGHPLVWLFFGGFVLAAGTERSALDRLLARVALVRFGTRPSAILAGVMCVTFGFSAFMSNTATTALMLTLLAPVLRGIQAGDPFKKSLLLGTAVAANLGGMSSLIGTPPNAIAAGLLSPIAGQSIDFLRWLSIGLPLASLLSILGWLVLLRLYPAATRCFELGQALSDDTPAAASPLWTRLTVAITGVATVGLWVSSGWHPLPIAVVSLLPVVVFTTLGVLGPTDIRGLPWDVLFLLAGGLTLGSVVGRTGLAHWLVAELPISALGVHGVAILMAYVCAILSNFMSNTAAANILLPIGVGLAPGAESHVALPIALAASVAMCLPIATPPNALVFSTGEVATRDFLRLGLLFGALAPALAVLWVWLVV